LTGRERFQFLTKHWQWQSGSDWGRQAVPCSWYSHWESRRVDRFFSAMTNVSETEERWQRRPSTSAVRRRRSARYVGVVQQSPARHS